MSTTIGQIEFELEKAEHGMGLPYDAERVGQLPAFCARCGRGNYPVDWPRGGKT